MTDNLVEARLLPRRKDGDIEVVRMTLFTTDGDPITLTSSEQTSSGLIAFMWSDDLNAWTYDGVEIDGRPEGLVGWRPWLGGPVTPEVDPGPTGLGWAVMGEVWYPEEAVA